MKTYVVTPHQNRLEETVLMMGFKIWRHIANYLQIILNTPFYLDQCKSEFKDYSVQTGQCIFSFGT